MLQYVYPIYLWIGGEIMDKFTIADYIEKLQAKKEEAHNKQWLYIECNAKDLMEELEPGVKNMTTCCKAMLEALLEGDIILAAPKTKNMCGSALTLRYYVDNLSPERRKYSEVN
mgnify:FL=1